MRTPEPVLLQGHGVRLEPATRRHDPGLLVAAQHDELWRWLPVHRPRTVRDVTTFHTDPTRLVFVVVIAGEAVGSTSYLDVDLGVAGLEIGATWYRRDLWGTHVNPACKLLLLEHAFEELGVQRLTLKTDALNARSRAAIAKLGFAYDGTLRHHRLRADGSVRDTAYFSLLEAEWPRARQALHQRLAQLGSGTTST